VGFYEPISFFSHFRGSRDHFVGSVEEGSSLTSWGMIESGTLTFSAQILAMLGAFGLGCLPISLLVIRIFHKGPTATEKTESLLQLDSLDAIERFGVWPIGSLIAALHAARAALVAILYSEPGIVVWESLGLGLSSLPDSLAWWGTFFVVLGQVYNPFSGFRAGRGVFATWGGFVILSPWVAGAAALGFGVAQVKAGKIRISSLSGLLCGAVAHLVLAEKGTPQWVGLLTIGVSFFRHSADLDLLLASRSEQ
jgi:glycerol-3-phosphate acyltransferase PlsY